MDNSMSKDQIKQSVGIIGCGWLGKALAGSLSQKNIQVLATSSKLENVDKLLKQSINAQPLTLPADEVALFQHDVFKQECLVIAITPQYRQGRTDYPEKVKQLIKAAAHNGIVERIILLSSTAVYDGLEGTVDEDSTLNLATEKVALFKAAEQAVLTYSKQGFVLRLAGLVGPERHPGKFLLAKRTLSNSMAPVNLIHQQDAVGLIEAILQASTTQCIFNGVSDTHISKRAYYQAAAKSFGLTAPAFIQDNTVVSKKEPTDKIVSGAKAKQELNYTFAYPDLVSWVASQKC